MSTQSSSTIKLNLPSGILTNAKGEATRIGISVQDFIRMLMSTYFANPTSIRSISREQALINRAELEISRGEYTEITSKKQFDAHFKKLKSLA